MAKGMRDIQRQIRSVRNTRQITKAMEMVAASKLKRAQMNAEAARPYAEKIREVILNIASSSLDISHPMLEKRPIRKTGYIIITSDRGLAGGYNSNLLRKAVEILEERHQSSDEYSLFVLGRKGRDFFRRRGYELLDEVVGLPDSPYFDSIKDLASKAVRYFAEEQYDELNLIYNEFINPMQQVPVEKRLLPLEDEQFEQGASSTPTRRTEYIYEPSAEGVLNVLLPKYAETLIYSALLEAKASEFGARMTAMGNATNNASEMIDQLTLSYNRARQAAITQEITEIVAGASALT